MSTVSQSWDLSSYFPSFESDDRDRFERELFADIQRAVSNATALPALDGADGAVWEAVVVEYERLSQRLSHLSSYVLCLTSADAQDERYSQAEGRLNLVRASLDKLAIELRRAVTPIDDAAFARFVSRTPIAHAAYALGRLRIEAKTSMEPALEGLTADLGTDGIMAWGRLYDRTSGRLSFEMQWPDGKKEVLSVSQRRSLMADADRTVRRAAFDCGNRAWQSVADILAATLNHIAGTRLTLNARRKVGHFLDVALHQSAITRKTLDAMFQAVSDRIEVPRRGFALKARAMGLPACAWYDLEAPFPLPNAARVPYEQGVELVRGAFSRAYPRLAHHFDDMLARRWIEARPSDKKRPGAFCTGSDLTDETRVFMSFQGSLGDVSTLAHEVGHAFHAEVLRGTKILERQYPMTLAETASTFAEAILADGLLADTSLSRAQRALLLGKVVSDGAAFLLDVPTRFYFEKRFYEERAQGEVSGTRLSELMVEAQRDQFGEALGRGEEDPLYWASKLHFFIPDLTFYNFPYTFGYLLSRGMYALFRAEGPSFIARYEAFLAASGRAMAHEVAKSTIGCDLETPRFWADAIDTLIEPTDELERLLVQPS
ncbi:MAG: M3 family oligoendopeptidase [Polyangiaceae bacterium]|nr:M3 family oligoendopeptidase [Polyangiaceae bacterium]